MSFSRASKRFLHISSTIPVAIDPDAPYSVFYVDIETEKARSDMPAVFDSGRSISNRVCHTSVLSSVGENKDSMARASRRLGGSCSPGPPSTESPSSVLPEKSGRLCSRSVRATVVNQLTQLHSKHSGQTGSALSFSTGRR
jgi:hypothetical protein